MTFNLILTERKKFRINMKGVNTIFDRIFLFLIIKIINILKKVLKK